MKKLLCFLLPAVLWACGEDKYPGFFELGDGIYYKIHIVGHGETTPKPGDHLLINMDYRTRAGEVLYSSSMTENRIADVTFGSNTNPVSLEQGLMKLREGDSVTFILNGINFFKDYLHQPAPSTMTVSEDVFIDVRLVKLIAGQDYPAYQESLAATQDGQLAELGTLAAYLSQNDTTGYRLTQGIYYQELKPGNGKSLSSSQLVALNYTGYFLDGTLFDSTPEGEPVVLRLGKEDHFLPGMEIGVLQMTVGGQAKFIIPSQLAYGSMGSSSGIVPPYTTLIYEVELVEVTHP